MARIPYAEKKAWKRKARHRSTSRWNRVWAWFRTWLSCFGHSGPATQGIGTLLDIYFGQLSISNRLREIAYLTVARLNGCDYCQGHHVPAGKQAGLLDMQIDELDEAVLTVASSRSPSGQSSASRTKAPAT